MSRKSARAIVIKDDKLLVMHRNKFGDKYVTLPGGTIEIGERPEETALREVAEETSIEVKNPQLVIIEHAGFYGDQFIFLCDYVSGDPKLTPGTHEYEINKMGSNLYEPGWLELEELPRVPFLSAELKQVIVDSVTDGWSDEVQEFASKRNV